MKVLIACEFSGRVREAFRARGHEAVSCDLLPSELPGPHYQGDVRDILDNGWDLMVAHPPCTHLAVSGARWFKDKLEAIEFGISDEVREFMYNIAHALPDGREVSLGEMITENLQQLDKLALPDQSTRRVVDAEVLER